MLKLPTHFPGWKRSSRKTCRWRRTPGIASAAPPAGSSSRTPSKNCRKRPRRCAESDIRTYVLGLGANLLVSDAGVDGAVFRLDAEFWRRVKSSKNQLEVGAGADMQKLLLRTVRQGLAGIECLAGIPGTIGGGIRMNAGGKFGDIGSIVHSVQSWTPREIFSNGRKTIWFSIIAARISPPPFILGATLDLEEDDPERILRKTKEIWMYQTQHPAAEHQKRRLHLQEPPRAQCRGTDRPGRPERHARWRRRGQHQACQLHHRPSGLHGRRCASTIKLIREKVFDSNQIHWKAKCRSGLRGLKDP